MEYKQLSNKMKIPAIGLGTWGIGGRFEANTSHKKEEIQAIKEAIKLGFTHIDTAEIYGNGLTEEEIGIAIKKFDRKKLFITTKVWKTNLHYDDLIKSLENSLKRLQTDYVDMYIVHRPNPCIPVKETMEAMEHLVKKRKIRAIGVSNFSVSEIKEAQKYLKDYRIVANQVEYNLIKRDVEKDIMNFYSSDNIMVIAFKPLAIGKLAQPDIELLSSIAKKYKRTNAQIALKWVISHKNVIAISKSTNITHLQENLGLFGWEMEPSDKRRLEEIYNN